MKRKPFSFKGLYFTNHALERLKERDLRPSDIWAVWHNPQGSRYASSKGAYIYWRNFGNIKLELVAKEDNKGRWVVISVWSRQISEGKRESLLSLILKKIKSFF